jgi:ABC-2 type transport system permease protein
MWHRRTAAVVAHELRLLRRDPMPVLVLIVFPLILMAFLKPTFALALVASGHVGANGAEQVVPGQTVVNAFYVVGMTSFAFFAEYGWNTWDRLRASNASSAEIVAGKALPLLAVSVTQFVVIFAVSVPFFHLHSRGPLVALVPLVASFATCLVLLGVMITALCRTIQQANAFAFGGIVIFGALGGALVPIELLPAWARALAPATPTYWVMRGFRSVILDGRGLAAVALPCCVLLGMSFVFAMVSLTRFRFSDTKVSL